MLFTGTVSQNIAWGKTNALKEDIIKAAKMAVKLAHAHEFISRLPCGYNTNVTGSTDNLSQG